MGDCLEHEWPGGSLLTSEGLPRCPLCRRAYPGGIGRRPKKKRRADLVTSTPRPTPAPLVDRQQLAAGDTLEGL